MNVRVHSGGRSCTNVRQAPETHHRFHHSTLPADLTGKIGKVHKVQFILIGKRPEAETIINISHQPQPNLMLKVEFYPFIFSGTFKYSFYSPFIVHRKCRIVRAEIDLTLSVHIIIKRRSPFHPDARGKADIGILKRSINSGGGIG